MTFRSMNMTSINARMNSMGAKVPGSELARVLLELSLQGANWPRSEKAVILRTDHIIHHALALYSQNWPTDMMLDKTFLVPDYSSSRILNASHHTTGSSKMQNGNRVRVTVTVKGQDGQWLGLG